jgi:hypothetical protein
LPIYCKLFNIALNSGLIPESWSEGVIFPIYKNKGDTKDPSSYRPIITLVSYLSNDERVIVSKAFEKSTNVQYNIFPRDIYIEINACQLNMLSNVLYPFLNPVWDSEIKPTSAILIKKKSNDSNNVTLEQFAEYFKNLNELPKNEKDQKIYFDSVDMENVYNILNSSLIIHTICHLEQMLKFY